MSDVTAGVTNPNQEDGSPESQREISTRRLINAPRERVFAAFAQPEHLARWWGPAGFTNTFSEFDFRPGGHWRFVMHGPDGTDYDNHSVFDEIVTPERIVFRHLESYHFFRMTISLSEHGRKTELGWKMVFANATHCEEVKPFVSLANEQNLDRLEAELLNIPTH